MYRKITQIYMDRNIGQVYSDLHRNLHVESSFFSKHPTYHFWTKYWLDRPHIILPSTRVDSLVIVKNIRCLVALIDIRNIIYNQFEFCYDRLSIDILLTSLRGKHLWRSSYFVENYLVDNITKISMEGIFNGEIDHMIYT